jgi:hypothetical protein
MAHSLLIACDQDIRLRLFEITGTNLQHAATLAVEIEPGRLIYGDTAQDYHNVVRIDIKNGNLLVVTLGGIRWALGMFRSIIK